jgi:hypothetical protein
MSNFYHPFDARLEHRAVGTTALTTATVIDTITQRAAMRTAYRTIVGVESIDIAGNDESYQIVVELSNDNFTTVNDIAAILDLGATEVRQSGAPDTAAGDQYEILWTTEAAGEKYQYARIKLFSAGAGTESIAFYCYSTVLGNV